VILHVLDADYTRDYVIHLRFNDGAEGFVDLANELYGEMFAPLRDMDKFKAFRVDPELNTIVWENGADLAPEFLHDRLLVPSPQMSAAEKG
jgi:ribosomal protein L31E